jgi:hypothetical protein
MSATRYRLALSVTLQEMPDIALALDSKFPDLAKAVEKQWLEMLNSGVNIFGPYEHDPSEPIAGLSETEIVLMTGVKD